MWLQRHPATVEKSSYLMNRKVFVKVVYNKKCLDFILTLVKILVRSTFSINAFFLTFSKVFEEVDLGPTNE